MRIGELSKQVSVSKDTIRFYEKIGLIVASSKQAGARIYKEYGVETAKHLLLIKQAQGLGFTLNEIKQIVDDGGRGKIPKSEQLRLVEQKLNQIDEKLNQLHQVRTHLATKLNKLKQEE
ncbi:hypothetical protein AMR41_30795 [Hapalosiphon sp. MRB220]|nr:hypothetical protein AMR41_30795 [Hapalosiphon sp. MRB220]